MAPSSPTYWSFPTRIVYGMGSVVELGNEAKRLGATHALIVTDPGVRAAGLLSSVEAALSSAGVATTVFDSLSTNPQEAEVRAAAEAFADAEADLVVGLGGGAPLDTAKLVRLLQHHDEELAAYDDAIGGDAKITQPLPPMIAIPTTAGTGSEVGRSAVVTLEATGCKTVIFSPRLMPKVAVLDPALTLTLPASLTAATGFDALTHNVEAYCAQGVHPMADAIALEAIEMIAKHLPTAVQNPSDMEARGAMLQASMMGAVAFQKGLGACHSLAHPLGAEKNMHHGLANALCLPAVLDFNRTAATARIARVAHILGVKGSDVDTLAFECAGRVRAFRKELALPSGLGEVGVVDAELGRLAELAVEDACHQLNPRPCTRDDLHTLYRASL